MVHYSNTAHDVWLRLSKYMGYIKHKTIVVSSFDEDLLVKAAAEARKICTGRVSKIVGPLVNSYSSFFIAPDGSKEGWSESDSSDSENDEFISWINKQAYEDGSNCLSYVYVFFGEDNGRSEIISHN